MVRNVIQYFLACVVLLLPPAVRAADWTQPTPEELHMTTQAGAPDASAVILYKEEEDNDQQHVHNIYVRLKILTEDGKRYADIEIPYERRSFNIVSVAGRTIHSDGTIVPFAGKPYAKTLVKEGSYRYQALVMTMPDVQVGSILEYRYQLSYDDYSLYPPAWYLQGELYLRKGRYTFFPYEGAVTTSHEQAATTLMWINMLPKGVEVKHFKSTGGFFNKTPNSYQLDVENIPAEPNDEFLPPIHSFTYRVYFHYSAYKTPEEYWEKEGKYWTQVIDKFIGPGPVVKALVSRLTTSSDTPDQKLRKLYSEVMSYENTDFTRARSQAEEKAHGLREIKTTDDIAARKRGSGSELTALFVAMARAAGQKAYYMRATGRDGDLFNPNVLSMGQLDSPLAIVNVAGKDQFFDPGERYCAYGQLRWNHTGIEGLRQTDTGTAIAQTPSGLYTDAKTVRVARLTMDESGQVDGTIQVGYTGDPALVWRQRALEQDQAEVEKEMEESMSHMLPEGLNVKIAQALYLDDPTKQLVVKFHVQGPLAAPTSKRFFVPVEVFESREKPLFTQPKREMPVYFHYGYQDVDQVSITFPPSLQVESAPQAEDVRLEQLAQLREGSTLKGDTLTLTRNFELGAVIFKTEEYDQLRTFYSKVNHKDQEQLVLRVGGHAAGE